MTPRAALIELLGRVGAGQGAAVLVNDAELNQWPNAAATALKSQRLLAKARPASSVICPGCERECVMPVQSPPTTTRATEPFVVCDKRSDINRVPVPTAMLTQWRCSADAVCGFVAASLGLRRSDKQAASADLWNIGIATGNKRSQMLCLRTDSDLALVAGNNAMPLTELVGFHDGEYSVDRIMIRRLVDSATTADPRYMPSNAKREARKLDTQAMYEGWQKEYRTLKKKRRNMTDVWHSQQIAKMDIAQGRDAETIRRRMKK